MPDFNRIVAQLTASYPEFDGELRDLLEQYADPSTPPPPPHAFTVDVNQQSAFCQVCDGGTRNAIHRQEKAQ